MKNWLIIPPDTQLSFLVEEALLFQWEKPDYILMYEDDLRKLSIAKLSDYSNYCEAVVAGYMQTEGYLHPYKLGRGAWDNESKAARSAQSAIKGLGERFYLLSEHIWNDYYRYLVRKREYFQPHVEANTLSPSLLKWQKNVHLTATALNCFASGRLPPAYDIHAIYLELFRRIQFVSYFDNNFPWAKRCKYYFTQEYIPLLTSTYGIDFVKKRIASPPLQWHVAANRVTELLKVPARELGITLCESPAFISDVDRILTYRVCRLLHNPRVSHGARITARLVPFAVDKVISRLFPIVSDAISVLKLITPEFVRALVFKNRVAHDYSNVRRVFAKLMYSLPQRPVDSSSVQLYANLVMLLVLRTHFSPHVLSNQEYTMALKESGPQIIQSPGKPSWTDW